MTKTVRSSNQCTQTQSASALRLTCLGHNFCLYFPEAGKRLCEYARAAVCRVNAVVPGGIETEACMDWAAGVGMSHDDLVNYQANHIIVQRYVLWSSACKPSTNCLYTFLMLEQFVDHHSTQFYFQFVKANPHMPIVDSHRQPMLGYAYISGFTDYTA